MKLMVRSTGDGMENDWAVDLAVSKLEEGREGGSIRMLLFWDQQLSSDRKSPPCVSDSDLIWKRRHL